MHTGFDVHLLARDPIMRGLHACPQIEGPFQTGDVAGHQGAPTATHQAQATQIHDVGLSNIQVRMASVPSGKLSPPVLRPFWNVPLTARDPGSSLPAVENCASPSGTWNCRRRSADP